MLLVFGVSNTPGLKNSHSLLSCSFLGTFMREKSWRFRHRKKRNFSSWLLLISIYSLYISTVSI